MIDLSIIIPHHNDSKRLKRLLDTIPNKDNIEVIVIDDHSVNEEYITAKEVIEKSEKERIYFGQNLKELNSAGTCRNIGLDIAQGKWVLFADSDDYFTDDMYEIVSSHFDSDSDIIYFSCTSIVEETGKTSTRHIPIEFFVKHYSEKRRRREELELRTMPNPMCKLIRKKILDDNNIKFEDVIVSNDVMFSVISGLKANKIDADNRIIYVYIERTDSLIKRFDKKHYEIRKEVATRCHIYMYKNLSKNDRKELELRRMGIKLIGGAIKKLGFGGLKYYFMLKKAHVPLFW